MVYTRKHSVQNKSRVRYIKAYEPLRTIFITDPLAKPLAQLFAALHANPNVITLISIVLGFVPGILFAYGHWIWAPIIFELAFLMDCVDGKVARLRQMSSEFGARLDTLGELPRKPCTFIGIGAYFYLNSQPLLVGLTVAAIILHYGIHKLYVLLGISQYDLEFPQFHRNVVRRIVPRSLNLYNWFDEEFLEFELFLLIGGLIGLPTGQIWFFIGAAFVAILGLAKMAISVNHKRKGRYEQVFQDWAGTKGNLDKTNGDLS